jgi:Reverse transcriptase (RNA-dependent DNA polymerase)
VGAQTCINFNGNMIPYFPCQRGLRQGDPLSPFMFDLVTDALCQILIRGRDAGLIQDLGPVLDNGHNIINFHYADDTIFFLKADSKCVEIVLWSLYAFEALTGIKINFSKTELIPLNLSQEEASELASLVGCSLSQFSLKYLGVLLSDSKLKCKDWQPIIEKIQNKMPNWKGTLLSMGGRLVLLDSVLSATPLYMLSLYKVLVKIRKKMDSIRCQFL